MSNFSVTKKTETNTAYIHLCNDGIVRILLKSNSVITVPELKLNIVALNELIQDSKYAFLYYTQDNTVTHSNDARAFGKENENAVPRLCTAVVVNSLAHKLVANFYLKFDKPTIPFKVFHKMDDAERWCLEVYSKSQKGELV
ncbi:MAG: hypothetical protein H7141_05295 [Burkholderiales bacterium]|nr:hypothetical protein [Bacteroidia bacterium]